MATEIDICNLALQKLGATSIQSFQDNSKSAKECARCYALMRDAELEAHRWNFATQRFQLAASATAPLFGYANAYDFPADALSLLPPDPIQNFPGRDWIVEGRQILTNDAAPLNAKFVMRITDASLFPMTFMNALAARMAVEMCEVLTQSNTKKQACAVDYKIEIATAKKNNAIQNVPQVPPEDPWVSARANAGGSVSSGWGIG